MNAIMIRAKVKEERTAEVDAAIQKVFAAIKDAQPTGVKYASCKLDDGVSYLILLKLEGEANPLVSLPEFTEFQQNLKSFLAEPPTQEKLQIVGSYHFFE